MSVSKINVSNDVLEGAATVLGGTVSLQTRTLSTTDVATISQTLIDNALGRWRKNLDPGEENSELDDSNFMAATGANMEASINFVSNNPYLQFFADGIHWSYNGTPATGILTVDVDGDEIGKYYITEAGPGFMPWNNMHAPVGSGVVTTITLSAGGPGVFGTVGVYRPVYR